MLLVWSGCRSYGFLVKLRFHTRGMWYANVACLLAGNLWRKVKFLFPLLHLCSHSHQSVHGAIHLANFHSHLHPDIWKHHCALTRFTIYCHICMPSIWNLTNCCLPPPLRIERTLGWLPLPTKRPILLLQMESLFYLMKPLEHIDCHIIGYWTSSI